MSAFEITKVTESVKFKFIHQVFVVGVKLLYLLNLIGYNYVICFSEDMF